MAAESTRKTRMAIVEEISAGDLSPPIAATDYLAVQDGLTLTPSFEALENEELKASIGASKTIQGLENPEGEVSHYLYGAGVEGQPPEMDLLIKSAFGASSVASTEYDTTAGSTAGTASVAAAINVGVGEGATFERGEALLIKDSANGYSIRPIESISGDALTLGFNLSAAPAAAVNLGKAVLYKPDDSAHPSLSVWDFRGNAAVVQACAGMKVSEMSLEGTAGEFVNMSFSLTGLSFYWDPIEVTSATSYLDFTDDDGTFAAQVALGWYRDPHDLAAAVTSAMNNANAGETHSCVYVDSLGKFKITSTGTVLSLLFATGANTANTIATKIGFTVADETGNAASTGYTSDNALVLTSPQTPSLDGQDPLVAKDNEVFIGDFADNVCFCVQTLTFTLSNEITGVACICASAGQSEKITIGRTATVELTAVLDRYEAEKFNRFRTNASTRFLFNFGPKSGGNWVAGKSGCLYIPSATISAFEVGDSDGVVVLNMTLTAFTNSGEGEVYLNFV